MSVVKKIKKITKIVLFSFLIIIGLILILIPSLLFYINTDHGGRLIQSQVNSKIPGSLQWQDHRLALLKGEILFTSFAIKDPENEPIIELELFYLKVGLFPLLRKALQIKAFHIENPRIALQVNDQGLLNLATAFIDTSVTPTEKKAETKKESESPFNFVIDTIHIGQAQFSYSSGPEDLDVVIKHLEINAKGNLLEKKAALELSVDTSILVMGEKRFSFYNLDLQSKLLGEKLEHLAFSLATDSSQLSLTGMIDSVFSHQQLSLELMMHANLGEINHRLRLNQNLTGNTSLRLKAEGSLGNPSAILDLDYTGGRLVGYHINHLNLDLKLKDRLASIDTLALSWAGGHIFLHGSGNLQEVFNQGFLDSSNDFNALSYQANLVIDNLDLSKTTLVPPNLQGIIDSRIALQGKGIDPQKLSAQADISLSAEDLLAKGLVSPIDGAITLKSNMASGIASLKECTILLDDTHLSSSGTYNLTKNQINAQLAIDPLDLSRVLPLAGIDSIYGLVNLHIQCQGTIPKLTITTDLLAEKLQYRQHTIDNFAVQANLDTMGLITCSKLALKNKSSSLLLSGSTRPFRRNSFAMKKKPIFDVQIHQSTLLSQDFIDSIQARVDLSGQVHGTPNNLQGRVDLKARNIDLGMQTLTEVSLAAILDSQRVLMQPLTVTLVPDSDQVVNINGWVGLDNTYDISVHSPGLSFQNIQSLATIPQLAGKISIDLAGQGTFKNPAAAGSLVLSDLEIEGKKIQDLILELEYKDQSIKLDGTTNFTLAAFYNLTNKQFDVTTQFEQTDLYPYFKIANQKDLSGILTGSIKASGNSDSLDQVSAEVLITQLTIFHKNLEAINTNDLQVNFASNKITIPPTDIQLLKEGNLALQGTGILNQDLDFTLNASIPVHLATLFSEDLADIEGMAKIEASLRGTQSMPQIKAQIGLDNISMTLPVVMQKLHQVNGQITVTPEQISIDSINGRLDNGYFSSSGTIALDSSLKPTDITATMSAHSLPIQMPDQLDLMVNTDLVIQGNREKSSIEGDLVVLEGLYYEDINLLKASGIGQKKRVVEKPTSEPSSSFLSNMKFNVAIKSQQDFIVDNNLTQMNIHPDLKLVGSLNQPVIIGRVNVATGTVFYLGKAFLIQRGVIDFSNPYKIEPTIDIMGITSIRHYNINLQTSGTLENLVFNLSGASRTDNQELEHEDILSLMALGKTIGEINSEGLASGGSSPEQMLANLVAPLEENIKNATGLDYFALEANGDKEGKNTNGLKLTVGKDLNKRLTTKYAIEPNVKDMKTTSLKVIIEYKIMENILLQTYGDDKGNYGGETQFKWEFR